MGKATLGSEWGKITQVPKTCQTFCKKCGKHQPCKMIQRRKAGKDSFYAQGKPNYERTQSGYVEHTSPFSRERLKKMVLRLDSVEPNCRSKRMLAIKRCKHFDLGGNKRKKN
ncbi:large ribosomal subunit protein eL42-like [Mustela nigripes]|uniref:large ribosomal subunit protein eL42-like n=1 Tax=Mustela nigripes TaxID=77151 RepID=UPI002815349B|nr:large ribosomal subunit protein eL42-like [Mustela nigripes]